jgi:hypothetical protein
VSASDHLEPAVVFQHDAERLEERIVVLGDDDPVMD